MAITLNDEIAVLSQKIWDTHRCKSHSQRTLVSISGIPGSGKSTLARQLAVQLNWLFNQSRPIRSKTTTTVTTTIPNSEASHADLTNPSPHDFTVDIPMDGFHLSRAQLCAFADPDTAIHRRGAAFTYDAAGYCDLVRQLAETIMETTSNGDTVDAAAATATDPSSHNIHNTVISAPAFNHATKDPVVDSIHIGPDTRIVILEGNYVNLDVRPWSDVTALFDVKLMVNIDRNVARERLIKRHVASGICADGTSARWRVESTDDLNADEILMRKVDGVVDVVFGTI